MSELGQKMSVLKMLRGTAGKTPDSGLPSGPKLLQTYNIIFLYGTQFAKSALGRLCVIWCPWVPLL